MNTEGAHVGKVAPHLNKEVHLVASGSKPLAVIERNKDLNNYALAMSLASTGALYVDKDPITHDIVITKPCNKHLVDRYFYLLSYGVKELGIKQYHRAMGSLFGYTKADIEAFIDAEVHCDCDKCKGRF